MQYRSMNSTVLKCLHILLLGILVPKILAQEIAVVSGNTVTIDNQAIHAVIDGGRMSSLSLPSKSNLLNGGYGYFNYVDALGNYSPTSLSPQIKTNTSEIADIYFLKSDQFKVEMHYVFRKNESGFFVYYVISDNGISGHSMNSVRFATRVDKTIFNYAWNSEREGAMIAPEILENYVEEIQDATYLLQDSTIYTKYDWAVSKIHDLYHGLMGNGYGIWSIEPSHEYNNGGPTMQELTVHGTNTTPIMLTQFFSNHFGCETILLRDEYVNWTKIFGPQFIYINQGENKDLLSDVKSKADSIKEEWPFSWLNNANYPLERGTLSGQLSITGHGQVDSAMVILCKDGPSWFGDEDHWQKQPYEYQYFAEADKNGNFEILNIRPGSYTLFAYTQKGKLIDELKQRDIRIQAGLNSVGKIEWDAYDKQKTIFQIGIADHTSGEFKLADLPRLYGRWKNCPYTLTYDVLTDNPRDDWYYCQRVRSDWEIKFTIDDLSKILNPVLKVALAGSDANPHLDFILNGTTISTNDLGSDSGIRRSSLTGGKHTVLKCSVHKNLLVNGSNTLVMKCYGTVNEYKGLMYDAILLEADTLDPKTALKTSNLIDDSRSIVFQNKESKSIVIQSEKPFSSVKLFDLAGHILFSSHKKERNSVEISPTYSLSGFYILQLLSAENCYLQKVFF